MQKQLPLVGLLLALVCLMFSPTVPLSAGSLAAPSTSITSTFATTPPNVDGTIDFGEWNLANKITLPHGFITVLNDNVRLYVLLDVTGDTTNDAGDYFWLTFDVNRDSAITPNVDKNYGPDPNTGNLRYQYYLGPANWTGLQPNTYSSRGRGFGCFWADGTLTLTSIFPLQISCSSHRVWELGIDLAEINAAAGGSARMGVRVASGTPAFTDDTPANFDSDFSNLINVSLAPSPVLFVAPLQGATVTFDANPIELTQAVQTRSNSLSLVADKATTARIYALTANVAFPETVKTYLYGSVGSVDLPGSPLASIGLAPTVIDRTRLGDTANFLLPRSWSEGNVTFSAKAVDFLSHTASTTPFALGFSRKSVPTYWVVPINTGTAMAPVLASNAEIAKQESYLRAIYPLSEVSFVQKSWTVIGPSTVDNAISDLNNYYNATALAWVLSVIFTGQAPFTLPDQIYGLTPSGGGLSDPVWAGGAGRVARGFEGTSLEGTMAHEINHNLDRSASGTWGRHVPNDCGAGGPDSNWPYANSNINEVGFDTRLPWSGGGGTLTVVPSTDPDIMSYCQSGHLPTKWISPYRWTNLFNNFPAAPAQSPASSQALITTTLYLSGRVNRDGTGKLNPVLVQPGMATANPGQGDYAIQVLDKGSKLVAGVTFPAQFLDDPEEPVNTVYFNFQIQPPAGSAVGQILLKHGSDTLDQITVSANPPTVTVTSPKGGETWSGTQSLTWSASDPDGDPLAFTVLYSPDNGSSWVPVASNLTDKSLPVDTTTLPGGTSARFRVIVTDGFNTAQADSAAIKIADNPPVVTIASPLQNSVVPPGSLLHLEGDGHDPEDGLLPNAALLWKEGSTILGNGRELSVLLAPGSHTLTLTGIDSQGNQSQASVQLLVGARLYLPLITK